MDELTVTIPLSEYKMLLESQIKSHGMIMEIQALRDVVFNMDTSINKSIGTLRTEITNINLDTQSNKDVLYKINDYIRKDTKAGMGEPIKPI